MGNPKMELIKALTEFITENGFIEAMTNWSMDEKAGQISFKVNFDTTKLNNNERVDIPKEEEKLIPQKSVGYDMLLASDGGPFEVESKPTNPMEKSETLCEEKESVITEGEPGIEDIEPAPISVTIDPDYPPQQEVSKSTKPMISLKNIGSVTADKDGKVTVSSKEDKKKDEKVTIALNTNKTLYKEHIFSADEITYINAYIKHDITGGEGAELLGFKKASDFYNLVQRFKRTRNMSSGKTKRKMPEIKKSSVEVSTRPGQKLTDDDLDYIYRQVRRGDTLANFCREFNVASSTMTVRMRNFIQKNGLDPLFTEDGKRKVQPIVQSAPAETNNLKAPEGAEDGWHLLEDDNKFHKVKNGEVVV